MAKEKQTRSRTYARNRAATVSRRGYEKVIESDSTYFLKLVICVLLGTIWLRFNPPVSINGFHLGAVPVGMLAGFILVNRFEKLQSDRKIWYAILIIVTIICYGLDVGIIL